MDDTDHNQIESIPIGSRDSEPDGSAAGFLSGTMGIKTKADRTTPTPKYDPVTINPDFRVATLFLSIGLVLDQIPYIQLTLGPVITLLGLLFLVQTFRIRFRFTEDNELELVNVSNLLSGEVESSGENLVVGGANIWKCDTIVNYDFFPPIDSSPVGPILVYFKETQTPEESWGRVPVLSPISLKRLPPVKQWLDKSISSPPCATQSSYWPSLKNVNVPNSRRKEN